MADVLWAVLAFAIMVACSDAAAVPRSRNLIKTYRTPVTVLFDDNINESKYPEDLAVNLLAEMNRRNLTKYILRTEAADIPPYNPKKLNYKNICQSKPHSKVYPLRVKDEKTNNVYWMLNPKSERFQYFDFELCKTESSTLEGDDKCNVENDSSYTTSCVQEFIQRKVFFMSDDGTIAVAPGIIPSCCSCYIEATDLYMD